MTNRTFALSLLVIGLVLIIVGLLSVMFSGYWYLKPPDTNTNSVVATPIPTPSEKGKRTQMVQVPANVMWYDTNIDVTGKQVTIRYNSGQWRNHPTSGYNDGVGRGPYAEQNTLIVPNAPLSSLVGKTNGGTFYVGNQYQGKPGNGKLYLGINDKNGRYDDNDGMLTVTVTVE